LPRKEHPALIARAGRALCSPPPKDADAGIDARGLPTGGPRLRQGNAAAALIAHAAAKAVARHNQRSQGRLDMAGLKVRGGPAWFAPAAASRAACPIALLP
jgi:hypothetical protein